jgi:hypothetical protein
VILITVMDTVALLRRRLEDAASRPGRRNDSYTLELALGGGGLPVPAPVGRKKRLNRLSSLVGAFILGSHTAYIMSTKKYTTHLKGKTGPRKAAFISTYI